MLEARIRSGGVSLISYAQQQLCEEGWYCIGESAISNLRSSGKYSSSTLTFEVAVQRILVTSGLTSNAAVPQTLP